MTLIRDVKFNCSIVTNATLITNDIINQFKQYDISVGISIDGTKAINDKNRKFKNTYKSVYDRVVSSIDLLKKQMLDVVYP